MSFAASLRTPCKCIRCRTRRRGELPQPAPAVDVAVVHSGSDTTVVALKAADVQAFFVFNNWPHDMVAFDLGGRVLDVLAIPGHEPSSIAVYDRRTGLLFTGDTLYPGRLYVSDAASYTRSIQRLVDFTRTRIVTHILGNHIEEARTPFLDYPIGTKCQPDEHALELGRAHLIELNDTLRDMNGAVTRMALRDFTIWPSR